MWVGVRRCFRKGVTMSVAALSTAGFSQYISATSHLDASQQAWQSLQNSLAKGNISTAQRAFNTYTHLTSAASASGSSSTTSQYSTDMTALGSALSAGNLSKAQSAFATVQKDLNSNPVQAIANAEIAVKQTVQWIDDLLSLANSNQSNSSSSTKVDPLAAILARAYGLSSSNNNTDPMLTLLESKYSVGSTPNTSSTSAGVNTYA